MATAGYVIASLLTCRQPHDMDRLLHRGKYVVEPEAVNEPIVTKSARSRFHLYNIIGIDQHFTLRDRWVAITLFAWSMGWTLLTIGGSALYMVRPWSAAAWANFCLGQSLRWFWRGHYHDRLVHDWLLAGSRSLVQRLRTERGRPR